MGPPPPGAGRERPTPVQRFALPAGSAGWAGALAALRVDAAADADADALWPAGVPDGDALDERLAMLAVGPADRSAAHAAASVLAADPGLRELAVRVGTAFARARAAGDSAGDGTGPDLAGQPGGWPDLDTGDPDADRLGWLVLHAAALPGLLRWYADHGLDPEIAAATVADVGARAGEHRRRTGRPGLLGPADLTAVATGRRLRVGPLHVGVVPLSPAVRAAARTPGGGGVALEVRAPVEGGPLDPAACEAALAAAPGLLTRLHPLLEPRALTCSSVLLDEGAAALAGTAPDVTVLARLFRLLPAELDPAPPVPAPQAAARLGAPGPDGGRGDRERAVGAAIAARRGLLRDRTGWAPLPPAGSG